MPVVKGGGGGDCAVWPSRREGHASAPHLSDRTSLWKECCRIIAMSWPRRHCRRRWMAAMKRTRGVFEDAGGEGDDWRD